MLMGLIGSRDGLNSERRYVRTLAQYIVRYVASWNLGQAFAISIGLAVTPTAFGRARLARARLGPTTAVSGTPLIRLSGDRSSYARFWGAA